MNRFEKYHCVNHDTTVLSYDKRSRRGCNCSTACQRPTVLLCDDRDHTDLDSRTHNKTSMYARASIFLNCPCCLFRVPLVSLSYYEPAWLDRLSSYRVRGFGLSCMGQLNCLARGTSSNCCHTHTFALFCLFLRQRCFRPRTNVGTKTNKKESSRAK